MTKIQNSPRHTHNSSSSLPFPMELDQPSISADPAIAKGSPRVPFNPSSFVISLAPFAPSLRLQATGVRPKALVLGKRGSDIARAISLPPPTSPPTALALIPPEREQPRDISRHSDRGMPLFGGSSSHPSCG